MRNKQIAVGAMLSYFALAVNILVTIFYTPWMVAQIGKTNYGLYTLAISIIGVFLLDFGLGASVSRFVAKYNAEQQPEKVNTFLGAVFKLYLVMDCLLFVVLVVVFFILGNIYQSLTVQELQQFRIIYVIVAAFNLFAFPMTPLAGILNAYEKFIWTKLCDLIYKFLSVFLVVFTLLWSSNVAMVVIGNTVAGVVSILLRLVVVCWATPVRISYGKTDMSVYREMFSFSAWSTVSSIAQRITYNLAPSILAATCGSVAVALYAPISSIGGYYFMVAAAINGLFLPRISQLIADDHEEQILPLMIKVGRFQTAVLGLILVGFFCVGDDFLALWMGADFAPAYPGGVLIMLPALLEYSQQIGNTTILAKNYVKEQGIFLLCVSVVGAGVAYMLSKEYGVTGSCAAICITGIVNVVGNNVIHQKKIGINVKLFYKTCYGSMLIPIVATAVICRWLIGCHTEISVVGLAYKIVLVCIIYTVLLFGFGLNKHERTAVLAAVRKRRG